MTMTNDDGRSHVLDDGWMMAGCGCGMWRNGVWHMAPHPPPTTHMMTGLRDPECCGCVMVVGVG
jgi:hypothetical protein